MYMVVRNDGHAIGFHDEKEPCESFARYLSREQYHVHVIKRKKKEINYYDPDRYLVRYGDTYIPIKYITSLENASSQLIYDMQYAKDVLFRLLETCESEKKTKTLIKAIEIVDKELMTLNEVPPITELKDIHRRYEEFKNKMHDNN